MRASEKATGVGLGLDERGPLVADERRADGAGGDHVVGDARSTPAASARTSASATAPLRPKITVLTASFIAAPDPSGPRWKIVFETASSAGRARSRSGRLAADHERQRAGLGQA